MTMLQFSAMLYTATARIAPRSSWRFTALVACNSSTAVTSEQPATNEDNNANLSKIEDIVQKKKEQQPKDMSFQSTFHTTEERNGRRKRLNDSNSVFFKQFQAAKSVNDLLDLAVLPNLSTNNALKLISSITNQINSGKSEISDIEADERFIHLRKIVKSDKSDEVNIYEKSNNLSKYSQLATPAMITVIASLREQRDRNTPLLKMLSYNIVKYNVTLTLNQCATLLYSMAILNFPDKVLLEKIASDLLKYIPKNRNAALNKSIITSLGFLRYKNTDILDAFCDTLYMKSIDYKFLHYSSIIQTFAALQYKSQKTNLFLEKFTEYISPFETSWIEWLDIIWALTVLDVVKPQHIQNLLDPLLMEKNAFNQLNISKILKLLNINAVAQFVLKDYEGPFLKKDSEFNNVSIVKSKEKQMYINALLETLTEMLPSSSYFKINFDTNMGFLLDAEYCIDSEHRFMKVEDWNERSNNVRRIAIMMYDYHDYCIGQNDLVGSQYLYTQLLKARGYEIITLSYENFSAQDNVKKRINYLKQCMNRIKEMKPAKQMKSI
ncbi:PREDICTED: protein TBRG4 [Acromyrmex echinatior]|uniref:Protein TBRG4 n=1 Tax=Acromyrmex echinatior TaxID=103372 RepID=F4X6K0_ACREC|nr:PREDICTED: protein TBRG4 [Acromyrmex echinatior]EGI57960.1 Protein TBRG4 [Acromyrmex echinatior]